MVNGNHIYAASSGLIRSALTTLAMRLFDLNKLKIIRTAFFTISQLFLQFDKKFYKVLWAKKGEEARTARDFPNQ